MYTGESTHGKQNMQFAHTHTYIQYICTYKIWILELSVGDENLEVIGGPVKLLEQVIVIFGGNRVFSPEVI